MQAKGRKYELECGLTLLELLIAISILAMISLFTISSLQLGRAVMEASVVDSAAAQTVFDAQERLRSWVSRAYPFDPNRTSTTICYPVEGDNISVEFSAPIHSAPGQNDLYRTRLRYDKQNGSLLADFQPDRNDMHDADFLSEVTLLSQLTGFTISYLEPISSPETAIWNANWQGRSDLPIAIKFQASFDPNDTRTWPSLVVHLAVTGRMDCDFDPVSRECR